MSGTVEIVREAGHHQDRMRAYKVLIDGQAMGTVREGETVSFGLSPGLHTIRLAVDFTGSPEKRVEVRSDETIRWRVRPAGRNTLLMLIESLVRRDRWIELEAEGELDS